MENAQSTEAVAQTEAAAPKEKKPRKMKKMKREDFIVNTVKAGERDALKIASALEDAAAKGEISMKKNHKVAPTPLMWFLQVKWYFHQAKKKGLVDGDLIVPPRERKPRKKKEAAPADAAGSTAEAPASSENVAAPAVEAPAETQAEASSDTIGTL